MGGMCCCSAAASSIASPFPPQPTQIYSPMHSPPKDETEEDANRERYLDDLFHTELNGCNVRISRKFSYIRCLELADRRAFQAKMIELLVKNRKNNRAAQEDMVKQGGIRMSTWRAIMSQIPLTVKYRVWRRAHWGENGRRKVDKSNAQVFTRYHSLLGECKGLPQPDADADDTDDDDDREVVNLLYSEQCMSRIPTGLVFPSNWSDKAESKRIWKENMCF